MTVANREICRNAFAAICHLRKKMVLIAILSQRSLHTSSAIIGQLRKDVAGGSHLAGAATVAVAPRRAESQAGQVLMADWRGPAACQPREKWLAGRA